jgi:hypothetical protein
MKRKGILAAALLIPLVLALGSGCSARSSRSTLLRHIASAILDSATAAPATPMSVASAPASPAGAEVAAVQLPLGRAVVSPKRPNAASKCVLRCKLRKPANGSKLISAGRIAVLRFLRSIEIESTRPA